MKILISRAFGQIAYQLFYKNNKRPRELTNCSLFKTLLKQLDKLMAQLKTVLKIERICCRKMRKSWWKLSVESWSSVDES